MAKRPYFYDQLSEEGKKFVDEAEDGAPSAPAPDETVAIIGTPKVPHPPEKK